MQQLIQRTWKWGLTLLFGLAVLLFWGLYYRGHISYQEQYQLFLTDADYWWERVPVPGGVADYVAEFLTQFFYHIWAGAALLALLFVALQRLVWRLMRLNGAAGWSYALSFLPVLLLWHYMGDENVLLSLPVALAMALLCCLAYPRAASRWVQVPFVIVAIPLLYWVAGPAHFLLVGWLMGCEWQLRWRQRNAWGGVGALCVIGIYGLFCSLLAGVWMQYPIYRLLGGINYYRFPALIPVLQIVLLAVLALWPSLAALLPPLRRKALPVGVVLVMLTMVGGSRMVMTGTNKAKDEAMVYDHLVRYKQWHTVVEMARAKVPTSPFSVVCLNLALAKTGQLGDAMFRYYQNGVQGLLPDFQRDFVAPMPTNEVYYHLGMVNTSQRFVFEAMEAIPNFRKSARCFRRLAETNLINGQYEVAGKYLRALQKTIFYKRWATETLAYLYDEERIDNHPEWGRLRRLRYTEDFLFSNREVDMMLGLLYERNHQNRMAFEYLLAYVMEQCDLQKFMKFYPLGKDAGFDHIPRHYQEALVYMWTQTHNSFQGMPWSISPGVIQEMSEFIRLFTARQAGMDEVLRTRFGHTYWYYLYNQSKRQR